MEQSQLTRAVLEVDEQGQVKESRSHPETPVSALMKRMDAFMRQAYFASAVVVALVV